MANIVTRLNLNKTPHLAENNSLIFAKNIRLDVDGTIHRDYGLFPMSIVKQKDSDTLINYKTIVNRILADTKPDNSDANNPDNILYGKLNSIIDTYRIVGYVPDSNAFYILITNEDSYDVNIIVKYDEKEDKFSFCKCNWKYSGGTLTGYVTNNLYSEVILTIGEYLDDKLLIPLKCINLNRSTINDDESIYTQTPNVPITNLLLVDFVNKAIPNGVYQFFVRYKIRDNYYTNWFPASKELFAGNANITDTSFGSVKFINTNKDSDATFKFKVEHLFEKYFANYESFQIGFIVSHDNEIVARAWKHFDKSVKVITFDYNSKDAEEIEVSDLLNITYQIYNVRNITSFKNKVYISNYKESDFNEVSLKDKANDIKITLGVANTSSGKYGDYTIIPQLVAGQNLISGFIIDGDTPMYFTGEGSIFQRALENKSLFDSIYKALDQSDHNQNIDKVYVGEYEGYGILMDVESEALVDSRQRHEKELKEIYGSDFVSVSYDTSHIISIEIDGIEVNIEDISIEVDLSVASLNALVKAIIKAFSNIPRYLDGHTFKNNRNQSYEYSTISIHRTARMNVVSDVSYSKQNLSPSKVNLDANVDATINNDITIDRPIQTPDDYVQDIPTVSKSDEYVQNITIHVTGDTSYNTDVNADLVISNTTLIPYQKYKFYIHYIKQSGETTNGYYCGGNNAGVIEAPYSPVADRIIYPKFENINIPEPYIGCFFSIVHCENTVGTMYNIQDYDNIKLGSAIDVNLNLVQATRNIHIKQDSEDESQPSVDTYTGTYYYSSDTSDFRYFGAEGVITVDDTNLTKDKLAYIISDYSITEADDTELIKCTPFISKNTTSFSDFTNMNLLGYICNIYLLDRERTLNYYTDGDEVYYKQISDVAGGIELEELTTYLDDKDEDKRITALSIKPTNSLYIYSNYNLNYLKLTEDVKITYKSIYYGSSNATGLKAYTYILRLLPSLTMSNVYTLPDMYRIYTRKSNVIYKTGEITIFNNTIRSSELIGDESLINIFKFNADDYYNTPTNRGIIVNLESIGDAILVHTKDSIFKFTGSNNLQSSQGEIQQAESQPFDTGVSEMFGSDFGFAGLSSKEDCITTESGYIFFDRDSRIVYMYSGQGQISKISDGIEKLFRHKDIKSIYFGNDYYNNRIFMSIIFVDNKVEYPVTLSFNVTSQSKSFISLHDFYYRRSFNTKVNCYFVTDDNKDICRVDKDYKGCYVKMELANDKTYPQSANQTYLTLSDAVDAKTTYKGFINKYDSIVDIIVNDNFENIKTLNAVKWCGSIVDAEFEQIDEDVLETLRVADDVSNKLPCKALRIYTDSCLTPLNDFSNVSNDYNINDPNSYKYPRFNQGYWSFNYFRNILNSKGHVVKYNSDNNSLIEGKYFVTRFIFDEDFKFETLTLDYQNKL